jgi:hypothetical protein
MFKWGCSILNLYKEDNFTSLWGDYSDFGQLKFLSGGCRWKTVGK